MKAVLSFLFLLAACLSLPASEPSGKPIVGKWENDKVRVEFTADGRLLVNEGSTKTEGTYTLPDDGHFKMALSMGGEKREKTMAYTISGDTLTTDDNGRKQTLTRASKNAIVGKWKSDAGQIEFTADGKMVLTMGSVTMNATYTLPDDDHFKMATDFGGTKKEKTMAYTVSGDMLTTDDSGKKDVMTRVK